MNLNGLRRAAPEARWTAVSVSLVMALVCLGGCEEAKNCPSASMDSGVAADLLQGDSQPAADLPVTCKAGEVQCASDETNAFGVCLSAAMMVKVPAGEFTMGQTEEGMDYSPARQVTLKEFLIDKTEVTVAQYKACVDCGACPIPLREGSHTGREPYYGNPEFENFPVIFISWLDAKAYCEAIGKRLPTEAQWEKAARGASANKYPWGAAKPTINNANYLYEELTMFERRNDTVAVTDFEAGKSPFEALNMAGNVREWVEDSYDAAYYAGGPAADPPGPAATLLKVTRGGGFMTPPEQITTYFRTFETESSAFSTVGFRCAKDQW